MPDREGQQFVLKDQEIDHEDSLYYAEKINPALDDSVAYIRANGFDSSSARALVSRLTWLRQTPDKTLEMSLLVSDVCRNITQITPELFRANQQWIDGILQNKSAMIDRSMLDASWGDRYKEYPFRQTAVVDLHALKPSDGS